MVARSVTFVGKSKKISEVSRAVYACVYGKVEWIESKSVGK